MRLTLNDILAATPESNRDWPLLIEVNGVRADVRTTSTEIATDANGKVTRRELVFSDAEEGQ